MMLGGSYGRPQVRSRRQQRRTSLKSLKPWRGNLGSQPYFGGENFGYVDVSLIPYYDWFYAYETMANISMEAECPKLVAWAKRCAQKKSVSESLVGEKKILGFVHELRKRLGLE
ncbi:hypothetical protein Patl1_05070 [Pistacia atlantica]|uniref:Uncharacterized protein n=1 Tax=Pistacia atlantica TaxID=434234 RepID=A0ACC1BW09_9ROSI|nr:hypothetical protein Patl1_05070 [Pistacia atlantica]